MGGIFPSHGLVGSNTLWGGWPMVFIPAASLEGFDRLATSVTDWFPVTDLLGFLNARCLLFFVGDPRVATLPKEVCQLAFVSFFLVEMPTNRQASSGLLGGQKQRQLV